jgi:hypothetical protein
MAGLAWAGRESVASEAPPPSPDRVPRAQYALLDVERYFEARGARHLDYCASRGVRACRGGTWLGLPADRVVAEVEELDDRYGPAEVRFQDEDFFADRPRVEAIAGGMLAAGGTMGWQVVAQPTDVVEAGAEMLGLLAESRCRKVHVRILPGIRPEGPAREAILETGRMLHAAGLRGRFAFAVSEPEAREGGLSAAESVARALCAMDSTFETPIRRHRPYPPEVARPAGDGSGVPDLEAWAVHEDAPWTDQRADRELERSAFYFSEAQRPPGRRLGKRVVRVLALARVRLGFFGLDVERLVVEASALLRTGRRRLAHRVD